ncbi:hypothetical protein GW7_05665 [Heterocephalus glaber]|uniref:Uncharacterized protein n=1 Tax=Heterocephalus glaber TaxID=10181 RepID=G5BEG8_HETGA|nr:hypothetical protein GW7_05665 [Heterocephalus glaber]
MAALRRGGSIDYSALCLLGRGETKFARARRRGRGWGRRPGRGRAGKWMESYIIHRGKSWCGCTEEKNAPSYGGEALLRFGDKAAFRAA